MTQGKNSDHTSYIFLGCVVGGLACFVLFAKTRINDRRNVSYNQTGIFHNQNILKPTAAAQQQDDTNHPKQTQSKIGLLWRQILENMKLSQQNRSFQLTT